MKECYIPSNYGDIRYRCHDWRFHFPVNSSNQFISFSGYHECDGACCVIRLPLFAIPIAQIGKIIAALNNINVIKWSIPCIILNRTKENLHTYEIINQDSLYSIYENDDVSDFDADNEDYIYHKKYVKSQIFINNRVVEMKKFDRKFILPRFKFAEIIEKGYEEYIKKQEILKKVCKIEAIVNANKEFFDYGQNYLLAEYIMEYMSIF
jgi:hypothetical protein